ncbi:MAG: ribose 5-phosphate isomerase B [Candidatus Omnitrophota bacterium]|jgi:ribose 5-phosphate isomerase B
MEKIVIASDHAGFDFKEKMILFLRKKGLEVKDLGTYSAERCDYPEYAYALAKEIAQKKYKRGILVCKSGIGNSIVANRLPGVRAALCYNVKAAQLSREHNDSNVLVMGSAFVSLPLAKKMAAAWLAAEFQGGRHQKRLDLIKKIEKQIGARQR